MSAKPYLFYDDDGDPMLSPRWALPPGIQASDAEAAFAAGGSLNTLDRIVGSAALWLGSWRYRLALDAADASARAMSKMLGRNEMRDAWYIRGQEANPGPGGNMFLAWRRLTERITPPSDEGLGAIARLMELPGTDRLEGLSEEIVELSKSTRPLPTVVLSAMRAVHGRAPAAVPLYFWVGDLMLAMRMRWPVALPVMSLEMTDSAFSGPRFAPHREDAVNRMFRGVGFGAIRAARIAAAMRDNADRVTAVLPTVRTKGAERLLQELFNQEAVPGFIAIDGISRFAVRRFMDRISESGGVSELAGRDTFRLYGL